MIATDLFHPRWGRPTYAVLLVAYVLFVVYGSLVPLRFVFVPPTAALERFGEVMTGTLHVESRTDLAVNVLLFVPLGYLLMAALRTDRSGLPGHAAAAAITTSCGAALTITVEFMQLFVPGRTVGLSDTVAETVGGAFGAAAWLAAGRQATTWLRAFAAERERPALLQRLLVVYCLVFAAGQVMPLNLTLNLGELAGKYRRGMIRLQPFSYAHESPLAAGWDYGGDLLLTMPLGMAAVLAWTTPGTRRRTGRAFALAVGAVACIEGAQLFVLSRYADVTDVIVGAVGVGLGVAIARAGTSRPILNRARPQARHLVNAARTGTMLWLAVLAAYHWSPYDFSLAPDQVAEGVRRLLRVPFLSYFLGDPFNAFTEMIRKATLAFPLGVLLTLSFPPPDGVTRPGRLRLALILAAGFLLLCGVETGQVFLGSRYPDLTDAFMGAIGVGAGIWTATLLAGARTGASASIGVEQAARGGGPV